MSHAAPWWVTISMPTGQTHRRMPGHYIMLSTRCSQRNNLLMTIRASRLYNKTYCNSLQRFSFREVAQHRITPQKGSMNKNWACKIRRYNHVVSWDCCITPEWPRWTAHFHRSEGGGFVVIRSDPATCFMAGLADVSTCIQRVIRVNYHPAFKLCGVQFWYHQAWLCIQTGHCIVWYEVQECRQASEVLVPVVSRVHISDSYNRTGSMSVWYMRSYVGSDRRRVTPHRKLTMKIFIYSRQAYPTDVSWQFYKLQ